MRFTVLEKFLRQQIENRIRDVTPGVVIRAYQNGRILCEVSTGQTFPYYDLASLTKPIFSVHAMMLAFERGLWNLDSTVHKILPWYPSKTTRVQDLLSHCSGLEWWYPFYHELNSNESLEDRRLHLKKIISSMEIKDQPISIYSDVGFLVLGFVLEALYQKSLFDVWIELKEKFYPGTTFSFHSNNQPPQKKSLYAPTEECPWRKRLLQGEVHDENCWALGGLSTHAGLFGSIDDVSWFALNLRSQLLGIAKYSIRQKTTQLFCRRARPPGGGDWAMGYMMPTPGNASCGQYYSLNSIGHTGFTGTSFWYDPHMDLLIIILSNRVMYGRDNKGFGQLRPEIHNWIVEGYKKSSI